MNQSIKILPNFSTNTRKTFTLKNCYKSKIQKKNGKGVQQGAEELVRIIKTLNPLDVNPKWKSTKQNC